MQHLDDLIQFENETSFLDFKAVQYTKPFEPFLKDVLAMANAITQDERFIIVGVHHSPSGDRSYVSIAENEFVDAAIYQQIVRENIEPELHLDYTPYRIDGNLLGIFKISRCSDKPYLMRKDFGTLRKGSGLIRKGSSNAWLSRIDLDRIYHERYKTQSRIAVRIGFDAPNAPTTIQIPAIGDCILPSVKAANEIRAILQERENPAYPHSLASTLMFPTGLEVVFGRVPYSRRSTETLRVDLAHVKETYAKDDLYVAFEQHAAKINLIITNDGEAYLEDSSIELKIPNVPELVVPERVYFKPIDHSIPGAALLSGVFDKSHYPTVTETSSMYRVRAEIGDLRHGIPRLAFEKPLRVVFGNTLIGQQITVECAIYAKQLRKPIKSSLSIEVTGPRADAYPLED